jgi:serine/threonine protein kinase
MQADCIFIDEKDHDEKPVKVPVFLKGAVINKRYQIMQVLNYDQDKRKILSGQGIVYKGIDIHTKQLVAIKQALYPNNQKAIEKIKREAFITIRFGRLNSYIVRGIDYIEFPSSLKFLIMEYIDGITLEEATYSRNRDFNEMEIINLLFKISKQLLFLSSLSLVMRDLKPANIMISKTGQLKLIDFGCCHNLKDKTSRMSTKINSKIYSTEKLREQGKCDNSTDLYSLGVIACFLITRGNIPDEYSGLLDLMTSFKSILSFPLFKVINSLITQNGISSAEHLQDSLNNIKV